MKGESRLADAQDTVDWRRRLVLRHTAATLLMAEGVNVKVASEMLGHADITTTLRIYSRVLPHQQGAAADAMDRLFRVHC
jgi:site-specific recombinase XerD